MANKKGGLGRGVDSLFYDNATESSDNEAAVTLKLTEISPNKIQARKIFQEEAISELADSIKEHGVLQPLLVRPMMNGSYQLIAGERRWRAARLAGLTQVPVIIKSLTDEEAAVISLIENLQRENLNPVEEANGYAQLIKEYGLTQEEAAGRVGKSRTAVTNLLRIIKLPKSVVDMISDGTLTVGHAKALAGLDDDEQIIKAAKLITEKGLSVRETEKLVKTLYKEKKPAQQKQAKRNSYYDEVELALSSSLGRKTRVVTKGKAECGTLEISFNDRADLEAIAKALSSLEE